MLFKTLKNKKGQAGLQLLLSGIAMLFLIGIIVMVFVIAGVKLEDAVKTTSSTYVANETLTPSNGTAVALAGNSYADCSATIDYIVNGTNADQLISGVGNYTLSGCLITANGTASTEYLLSPWNVSYTYSYTDNYEAVNVINETYQGIDDTVDWFPTIIVLLAIVVIILLVVLIINAVRGSGLLNQGGA